jgi:hypothetical protein
MPRLTEQKTIFDEKPVISRSFSFSPAAALEQPDTPQPISAAQNHVCTFAVNYKQMHL